MFENVNKKIISLHSMIRRKKIEMKQMEICVYTVVTLIFFRF
jgi:hypothetical protein